MSIFKKNKRQPKPWALTIGEKDLKTIAFLPYEQIKAVFKAGEKLINNGGILVGGEPDGEDYILTYFIPEIGINVYAWFKRKELFSH